MAVKLDTAEHYSQKPLNPNAPRAAALRAAAPAAMAAGVIAYIWVYLLGPSFGPAPYGSLHCTLSAHEALGRVTASAVRRRATQATWFGACGDGAVSADICSAGGG